MANYKKYIGCYLLVETTASKIRLIPITKISKTRSFPVIDINIFVDDDLPGTPYSFPFKDARTAKLLNYEKVGFGDIPHYDEYYQIIPKTELSRVLYD